MCFKEFFMARPQKSRTVHRPPVFSMFRPNGVPPSILKEVNLSIDEFEAIRLADYEGLEHEEASGLMGISRSTFTRLVEAARKKMSVFVVEGALLSISGGNIEFNRNIIKCNECGAFSDIDINNENGLCAACGSGSVTSLAHLFGHGKCCRRSGGCGKFNK